MKHFGFWKKLAATYSRGSYTTTTIGKAVFDGRVRNGIGSDHSFMATKKEIQNAEFRMQNEDILERQTAKLLKSELPGSGIL